MKAKDKIADLERRIKELEARQPVRYEYHYHYNYPHYSQPYWVPAPLPYHPQQPWVITTTGPNTVYTCTSGSHEANGGLITITQ